ncbi:MAG: flagellin [Candidatus Hydrogenedentota bacterium]
MGLNVNSNIQSIIARRHTERATRNLLSSQEKLSYLLRINRAADDAAGLAIAERFQSQVRQLNQEVNSFQSGTNLTQVAEGGLEVQSDALGRIRELAVQASNGTLNDDQRAASNEEAQQLLQEIDATAQNTEFNGVAPIANGTQEVVLDPSGDVSVTTEESTTTSLGIDGVDLSTQAGARAALDSLDNAQTEISSNRASLGAQQNRLRASIEQRESNAVDLQEAEFRIRDLDVGRAIIEQTRNEILLQAGALGVLRGGAIQSQTVSSLLAG